ncbi:hypothetical protein [Thorsellia kenyensis]|uniref:Uncharacterized protein n=1 Tax=Thorsellia kenyensis TaxID=1549888 RepID=A0ABV6CC06_9GAMM
MERVELPDLKDQWYLAEKAEFAMRLPKEIIVKRTARYLKQIVMSGLIRIEEYNQDYLWPYKAEVIFSMVYPTPIPMLATSEASWKKYPKNNLPHSSNPFAMPALEKAMMRGFRGIRRPDIILVKNESLRSGGD